MAFAGTAGAQGYFIDATAYCHATGQVSQTCPVGSAVTITPKAYGGTGFETFDIDPGSEYSFNPVAYNATEATFTYSLPGDKNVAIRATDGSNSYRGFALIITDPDGRPDPTLEPAYTAQKGLWEVMKRGSTCTVSRTLFFQSYRDYSYTGNLEARYTFRSRVPRARNSTKKRRTRVKKGRIARVSNGPTANLASYDLQVKRLYWRFDRQSPRIKRLVKRRATVTLRSAQRVTINGQAVTDEAGTRRIDLKTCT